MLEFIGRLHPVIVHLPIGIFILVILLEFASFSQKRKHWVENINPIIIIGFLFSCLSLLTGLILAEEGSNNEADVDLHKWTAIITTLLFLFYALSRNKIIRNKILYTISLIILSIFLFSTGHLGGSLTHGDDFLSFESKENLIQTTVNITDINQAEIYKDIIQPTLNMKCVQCHGADKQKGKLRLDDSTWLLTGGKNGDVINIQQPEQSELLKRILLELNNEHHMPPKGKQQLTDFELTIFQWWVSSGSTFHQKVENIEAEEKVRKALNAFKDYHTKEKQVSKREDVTPISTKTKLELEKAGWVISEISKEDHHIRAVGFNIDKPHDQALKKLLSITEQLVELKLTASGVSDTDLSILQSLKNIEKLWLDENQITDKGIKDFNSLEKLRYINLASTGVSKSGIENLLKNKSIQSVYLYQTGIDPNEITSLKKEWKAVSIFGADSMIKMPTDTLFQRKVK